MKENKGNEVGVRGEKKGISREVSEREKEGRG